MFRGSITALITPFHNGDVDWKSFEKLVEWQINSGVHGLVPCGTTGESVTLSIDEQLKVIKRCVDVASKRVPVIAGTGTCCTRKTIELSQESQKIGADGVLVVAPYYNKPTQDGLLAHYKAIHDATDIPILIYNVPVRTVIEVSVDTMCRLAELPRIVGTKDTSADVSRPIVFRRRLGNGFALLSGDDGMAIPYLAQGGHGCISVTANVAPSICAAIQNLWQEGNIKQMGDLRDKIAPLHAALFCETSPAPVKYAASRLGFGSDEVRLPLVPASQNARNQVDAAMAVAGILPEEKAKRNAA